MLTVVFPPTSGHAFINGYDIRTDSDKVHLNLGVCPQFNILWEDLTVEEHLLFYSRLKGIPPALEKRHVERSMHEVGLLKYSTRRAKDLSGGMKRRLSVAIALCGNSTIVFLDEPTTGLDPASRRQMWRILQRAKQGRAIVLTTHAMDEAELLSNRIGILARGRLRCLGSPTNLQTKFGGGYKLSINFSPANEDQAIQCVTQLFPRSTQISSFKGSITFNIPREQVQLSEAFAALESRSRLYGVSAFSLSQFGLEDVFQRIVQAVTNAKWSNQSNDSFEDVSEIDDDDFRV